jgi:hypothetical protein
VSQQLTEVKVTGSKNKVFGNGRTGAETTIEGKNNSVANNIKVSG